MLKDPKAEADQCQLKCFNEKEFKGILADSRAASFSAEMRTEITSRSATKVKIVFQNVFLRHQTRGPLLHVYAIPFLN